VCIMQAGPGILCTAWLTNPLTAEATSGPGAIISHCLFGLSTVSFLSVLLCLHQRRHTLAAIGVHPQWAPLSFPFINSAIASGVYRSLFPSPAITAWCCLLSAIAVFNHCTVNYMFFSSLFFVCDSYGLQPAGQQQGCVYAQGEDEDEMEKGTHCLDETVSALVSSRERNASSSQRAGTGGGGGTGDQRTDSVQELPNFSPAPY
jgi:hypothetical protein